MTVMSQPYSIPLPGRLAHRGLGVDHLPLRTLHLHLGPRLVRPTPDPFPFPTAVVKLQWRMDPFLSRGSRKWTPGSRGVWNLSARE